MFCKLGFVSVWRGVAASRRVRRPLGSTRPRRVLGGEGSAVGGGTAAAAARVVINPAAGVDGSQAACVRQLLSRLCVGVMGV